jgi:hypothetical protein
MQFLIFQYSNKNKGRHYMHLKLNNMYILLAIISLGCTRKMLVEEILETFQNLEYNAFKN